MKNIFLKNGDIRCALHTIIRGMQADEWKPDYIVGFTPDSIIPAVMLGAYLNIPVQSLNMDCSDGSMSADAFGYEDNQIKNILVVDAYNATGKNFKWLMNDWQESSLPDDEKWKTVWGNNVRFAVMINDIASGFEQTIYSGLEIDSNEKIQNFIFPWSFWWEV